MSCFFVYSCEYKSVVGDIFGFWGSDINIEIFWYVGSYLDGWREDDVNSLIFYYGSFGFVCFVDG